MYSTLKFFLILVTLHVITAEPKSNLENSLENKLKNKLRRTFNDDVAVSVIVANRRAGNGAVSNRRKESEINSEQTKRREAHEQAEELNALRRLIQESAHTYSMKIDNEEPSTFHRRENSDKVETNAAEVETDAKLEKTFKEKLDLSLANIFEAVVDLLVGKLRGSTRTLRSNEQCTLMVPEIEPSKQRRIMVEELEEQSQHKRVSSSEEINSNENHNEHIGNLKRRADAAEERRKLDLVTPYNKVKEALKGFGKRIKNILDSAVKVAVTRFQEIGNCDLKSTTAEPEARRQNIIENEKVWKYPRRLVTSHSINVHAVDNEDIPDLNRRTKSQEIEITNERKNNINTSSNENLGKVLRRLMEDNEVVLMLVPEDKDKHGHAGCTKKDREKELIKRREMDENLRVKSSIRRYIINPAQIDDEESPIIKRRTQQQVKERISKKYILP